jgi:hypothetical protein
VEAFDCSSTNISPEAMDALAGWLRERLVALEQIPTGAFPALVVAALAGLSTAQVLELMKVGSASSKDWVAGSGSRWCWLGEVRWCRLDQQTLKIKLGTVWVG